MLRTDRTPLACLILMVAAIGMSKPVVNGYYPRPTHGKEGGTVEPAGDWIDVGCWLAGWTGWLPCPKPVKDPPMPKPKELTPDTPTCDPSSTYGPC